MSKQWSLVEFIGLHPAEKRAGIPSLRERMWTCEACQKCSIFVSRDKVDDASRKGIRILSGLGTNRNTGFPLFRLFVEPAVKKKNIACIKMQKKLLPLNIWTNGEVSLSLKSDMKHGNVLVLYVTNSTYLSFSNSDGMLGVS